MGFLRSENLKNKTVPVPKLRLELQNKQRDSGSALLKIKNEEI